MSDSLKMESEDRRNAIREQILNEHVEAFFRRWAPDGREDLGRFGRDLHNLTRVIYETASQPHQKMINEVMKNLAVLTPSAFTSMPHHRQENAG